MTEVATLGLKVDGVASVERADKSLDGLSRSAEQAERASGGLTGESRKTTKSLADAAKAGSGASVSFSKLSNVARIAAAAIGGLTFGRLISETANFEDAMLGLQAVSSSTAEQMAVLEKQARELGATSMFSAQQAGDAQRFLAQAGFEVNEILSATPGILDLAAAGQLDLAQAADIASNVLGGMRLEVDQLGRVNDVLAATAAGANTNIEQLGNALSFAAPFAAAAGISIEETAAAIGAMSDAGIQASRAGTGLVGIIRQLSKITPAAASALEQAGIAVEDVNIEARGLGPVLETLSAAGLSVGQAIEIFGSEAGAAALNVIEASDSIEGFTNELGDAEGSAKEMAGVLSSGLTGSIRSFQSALSESLLQLGDSGLSGAFKSVVDSASGVLSVYNGMLPQFSQANDLTREQEDSLRGVADALRVVAGAAAGYVGLVAALKAATVAQIAFNAASRANPYIIIATAVGAATVAIYDYVTAQEGALRAQERLWEDAATSSTAYALAQSRIADGQRLNDELMAEQMEKQEELNDLRESGFKRYSGDANKAKTLEREIAEIEDKRRRLSELRMEADKAEMARINQAKEEQIKLEQQINDLTDVSSGGGGAEAAEAEAKALDKLIESASAYTQERRAAIETDMEAQAEREKALESVRQSLLTEEDMINQSYERRLQMVLDNTREGSAQRLELEEQLAEQRNQKLAELENKQASLILSSSADLFGNLADLAKTFGDEQSSTYKTLFAASKAFAIANASLQIVAAAQALADPTAPTLTQKLTGYATIAGLVGNIVSTISSTQASFEGGGFTGSGARTGGIDGKGGFPAILHPNETVVDHTRAQSTGGVVVNLYEDASKAGQVNQREDNGQRMIDVFVSNIRSDGAAARAMQSTYGLQRRGS